MSDSTSPLTRDERMWCGARDGCTFEMIVGMAVFGATGGNPSGSRPNFFGRQHLTFDKGGKCIGNFRGIVRFWKGWCGSKGIEIDRSANIKASEALTIPTVTARNSFRIVKVGLSEYCTASQKIISAVPPPLFRGEARVIVLGKSTAKPTERS